VAVFVFHCFWISFAPCPIHEAIFRPAKKLEGERSKNPHKGETMEWWMWFTVIIGMFLILLAIGLPVS
jgi:hypothetical protein